MHLKLTRSQSRKTVYEVRLYEPVWFKNNKICLFMMHNLPVVLAVIHTHTHTPAGFNTNLNKNGKN